MKKKLYISIGMIILGLGIILGANYLLSLHKVTFTLDSNVTSAAIYRVDSHKIKDIKTNTTILLQAGKYYLIPEGKNINEDKIGFTVNKGDMTVSINPDYTKEYLNTLLKTEKPLVEAVVASKYPTLIGNYTFQQETLYKRGEWFGALLAPKVDDARDQLSPYRIILYKKDGKWEVLRRPEYVLNSSKYTNVPIEVLRAINKLVQ